MKYWIVPCDEHTYRIDQEIEENDGIASWRQNGKFSVGDIVFIYKKRPDLRIRYKMEVVAVGLNEWDEIFGDRYWVDKNLYYANVGKNRIAKFKLLEEYPKGMLESKDFRIHNFSSSIVSVKEVKGALLEYLLHPFGEEQSNSNLYGVELVLEDEELYEGTSMMVAVNKYERNAKAREECIRLKGCRCAVCGMDFDKVYGTLGKGFIHVHHVVPISSIGEKYKLNVATDLVPVCPNCHYMLHRKPNGGVYTVEELRELINKGYVDKLKEVEEIEK